MKITTKFPYKARHIPPRGKNFRETPVYENLCLEIAEPTPVEAPVSARVGLGVAGNSHSFIVEYEFRWFNDAHWVCMTSKNRDDHGREIRPAELVESIENGDFFRRATAEEAIRNRKGKHLTAYDVEDPIPAQKVQAKEFDHERREQAIGWLVDKSEQIFFFNDQVWQRVNEPVFAIHNEVVVVRMFKKHLGDSPGISKYISLNATEEDLQEFQEETQEDDGPDIRVTKRDILLPEAFRIDCGKERMLEAVHKLIGNWWWHGTGNTEESRTRDWAKVDQNIVLKWFAMRDAFITGWDQDFPSEALQILEEHTDDFIASLSNHDRSVIKDSLKVIEEWRNRPLELDGMSP